MSDQKLSSARAGHRTVFKQSFTGQEMYLQIAGYNDQFIEKWEIKEDDIIKMNSTFATENYGFYPEIFIVSEDFTSNCN